MKLYSYLFFSGLPLLTSCKGATEVEPADITMVNGTIDALDREADEHIGDTW